MAIQSYQKQKQTCTEMDNPCQTRTELDNPWLQSSHAKKVIEQCSSGPNICHEKGERGRGREREREREGARGTRRTRSSCQRRFTEKSLVVERRRRRRKEEVRGGEGVSERSISDLSLSLSLSLSDSDSTVSLWRLFFVLLRYLFPWEGEGEGGRGRVAAGWTYLFGTEGRPFTE